MASTLASLRNKLRTELKIDPNGNIWNDNTLNLYLNDAYAQIQRDGDYDWRENIGGNSTPAVSAGTAEYTVPTDVARYDVIRFGGNVLEQTTKTKTTIADGETTSSGDPSHYYLEGTVIGLWPTPNSVKTLDIDYRKRLTPMSDDADTIDFNTDYDNAIVNYAAYLAWNGYRGASGNGQVELAAYERQLETLRLTYLVFSQSDLKFNQQITGPGSNFNSFPNNAR